MDDEGDPPSGPERRKRERERREADKRLRDFAAARSHQEAKDANELAKSVCQALILVNGGALSALLAYAGSPHPALDLTQENTRTGITIFCLGLFFAFMAAARLYLHAEVAAHRWESLVTRGEMRKDDPKDEKRMWRSKFVTTVWMALSVGCLCGGGVFLILGLAVLKPAQRIEHIEQAAPAASPRPASSP